MIDRKALQKLVEVPKAPDDSNEPVTITKGDLRELLSVCIPCLILLGVSMGMFVVMLIVILSRVMH